MNGEIAKRMQGITPFYVMELLKRARELEQQGRDIVHMEVGEPDFPCPDKIIHAGINSMQDGHVKYTPAAGLPELREKIAAFYQQQYDVYLDPERVFVTPGASGAFVLAFAASLNPGDGIIMADPGYPCNSNFVQLFDGKAQRVAVNAQTDYQLTAKLIEQHWQTTSKGVLIASPSNPTGSLITVNELQQSINTCARLGGHFYSDEIYHGLVYQREAQTALKFSDEVFVINSFSKYFSMTGWRIGWLVVPENYIDAVEKLAQNIFISSSSIAQYAALHAFDQDNIELLEQRRDEFARRGEFLYDKLQEIGFELGVKPEGAFYIYANCSKFTDDSFTFARDLLEAEGVAVTPGKDFGQNQPGQHIRFAYTTSIERMQEGIERIRRFVHKV